MSNSTPISDNISEIIQNLSTKLGTACPEWVETLSKKAHSKNITLGEWNALVSYAGLQAGDAELFKAALGDAMSYIGKRIDSDIAVYGDTASAKEQAISAKNAANDAAGAAQASENAASASEKNALDYSLIAEGYAVGTQNGVPVPWGSPYNGKDAKTMAQWAQQQAARSETAATNASTVETRVNAVKDELDNDILPDIYNLHFEVVDARDTTSRHAEATASDVKAASSSANSAAASAKQASNAKDAVITIAERVEGLKGETSGYAATAASSASDAKHYAEEAARIVSGFGDGVDQTYNPQSANAQSGIAVAEAIGTIKTELIPLYTMEPVGHSINDIEEAMASEEGYTTTFQVEYFNRMPVVGDIVTGAGRTPVDKIIFHYTAEVIGIDEFNDAVLKFIEMLATPVSLIPTRIMEPGSSIKAIEAEIERTGTYTDAFRVGAFNRPPEVGDVFTGSGRSSVDNGVYLYTAEITNAENESGNAEFKTLEFLPVPNRLEMAPIALSEFLDINEWQVGRTNSFRVSYFNRPPVKGDVVNGSGITGDGRAMTFTAEITDDVNTEGFAPFVILDVQYCSLVEKAEKDADGNVISTTYIPKIDPAKVPNGDPTNPATDYNIGTYAGVYTEYFGSDGKWRPRLLKSNAASYANLTEASVTKFVNNLKTTRIPITDSVGRLSVAAPQKGSNGETHYYNPKDSPATNNTYNCAVPLWYADERYIKNTDRSSIVQEAKSYTDTEIEKVKSEVESGGGGRLYRHDIYLSSWLDKSGDVWFSFYNTDPISYESHYTEDEETFEVLESINLTRLNTALGTACWAAYGKFPGPNGDNAVIGVNAGGIDTVYLTAYSIEDVYGQVITDFGWRVDDCYDTVTAIIL